MRAHAVAHQQFARLRHPVSANKLDRSVANFGKACRRFERLLERRALAVRHVQFVEPLAIREYRFDDCGVFLQECLTLRPAIGGQQAIEDLLALSARVEQHRQQLGLQGLLADYRFYVLVDRINAPDTDEGDDDDQDQQRAETGRQCLPRA